MEAVNISMIIEIIRIPGTIRSKSSTEPDEPTAISFTLIISGICAAELIKLLSISLAQIAVII